MLSFPFTTFVFSKYSMWLWICVKNLRKSPDTSSAKIYRTIMYHMYVSNTLGLKVTERGTWLLEC